MTETSGVYAGATTASARERALCEERRWDEAGRLVAEIARRLPGWFRLPPDLEQDFLEQLHGVVGHRTEEPSTSEPSGVYTSATTASTASARERELFEERRWDEAGDLVMEIARRVPDWFRLPPDVEQHFQQACIEQLLGVRAMIDHRIAEVSRLGRRRTGARVYVE